MRACLNALADQGLGVAISVGGGIGLLHYLDYRTTHDVDAQLEPLVKLPWADVWLDSLSDLVASKMVALIERGAPRDLRDIHALCHADLVTPERCWALWRRRQQLAGSDTDPARARLAIETHLARIEQHRPLAHIEDAPARAQAEQVRTWFREAFLNVIDVD